MNEEDNMAEEMSREFDFIREEVKILNEQQEKLCKYIEDNFEVEGWRFFVGIIRWNKSENIWPILFKAMKNSISPSTIYFSTSIFFLKNPWMQQLLIPIFISVVDPVPFLLF